MGCCDLAQSHEVSPDVEHERNRESGSEGEKDDHRVELVAAIHDAGAGLPQVCCEAQLTVNVNAAEHAEACERHGRKHHHAKQQQDAQHRRRLHHKRVLLYPVPRLQGKVALALRPA
jgi:hypothetical protein